MQRTSKFSPMCAGVIELNVPSFSAELVDYLDSEVAPAITEMEHLNTQSDHRASELGECPSEASWSLDTIWWSTLFLLFKWDSVFF